MQRVLAVSPHLDDAVLSVGATLADLATHGADVQVVTLFAAAPHESLSPVARAFHANCGLPGDASAAALRLDEDRAAMDELGARPHHCGFLDAVYRRAPDGSWLCGHDRAMFDDLPLDREGLLGELSLEIGRIIAAVTPDLVLTCAAVGNHIDHRLTRAAVLHTASSTEVRTLTWEDLPYAISRSPIMTTSSLTSLTRTPSPEAWERKWCAIARYTSQVRMLWPADADWIAELSAHAAIRGNEAPAELLLPPPLQRHLILPSARNCLHG